MLLFEAENKNIARDIACYFLIGLIEVFVVIALDNNTTRSHSINHGEVLYRQGPIQK